MKRLVFIIAILASMAAMPTTSRAADKPYRLSLYITPPEGAEYTEIEYDAYTSREWMLDGEIVRPYWSFLYTDYEFGSPDNNYQYGFPLSYGDNHFNSLDQNYIDLDAENFPVVISAQPRQDLGYSEDRGGIMANGAYYPFDSNWTVTLTEPGSYKLVGLLSAPIPGQIDITTDCSISYTVGPSELKSLTSGTVSEMVYPETEVRIYPGEGVKFHSAYYSTPGSSDNTSLHKEDEGYYTYTLPSVSSFNATAPYTITIKRERMQFTVISNVVDAITKYKLDVVGATYNGEGKFTITKADSIRLHCTLNYRIESVTNHATGEPLEYDPTTYVVKGVSAGMTINVTLAEVPHTKKIYFAFYNTPSMNGNVTAKLAVGTGRQAEVVLKPTLNTLQQVSFADADLPIAFEGMKYTYDNKEYTSTLFLNNTALKMNADGTPQWPDEIPDGSVIRFVNTTLTSGATRIVKVAVDDDIDVNLLVDKRNVGPANGSFVLPVGAYVNLVANTGNVYAYTATYSSNLTTGVLSDKSDFRIERGYTSSSIIVSKANPRNLMVYVEESDDCHVGDLTLAKGKKVEKTISLTSGYQPLAMAVEDLPLTLGLTSDDSDVAVYLNNVQIAVADGVCSFPETLPDNSVLKIFKSRPGGVPTASVTYDFSSLKDFDVALIHDNISTNVDPSLQHNLLPGTEIRFTIDPKGMSAKEIQFRPMAQDSKVVVKVNSETVEPDSDGSYMVKINDDHIANGLKIEAYLPQQPASVEQIAEQAQRVNVYSINGILVFPDADTDQINSLPAGIYIIGNRTTAIR